MKFILYACFFLLVPVIANANYSYDAEVSGHITFARPDASLEKVYITLIGPIAYAGSSHLYTTYTDSTGFYKFKNLLAGKYKISCYPQCNYCFPDIEIENTIELKESEAVVKDFHIDELALDPSFVVDLRNASISGCVTDGNAVATNRQARIRIRQLDRKYPVDKDMYADSIGCYRFDRLCGGKYVVTCHPASDSEVILDTVVVKPGQSIVHNFNIRVKSRKEIRDSDKSDTLLVGNLNFHFGRRIMGELSIGLGHVLPASKVNTNWETLQLGTEFNFNPHHFILGPKLTYNYSPGVLLFGLDFGGSFIYYTDFSDAALYFKPHLGFGIQTIMDVYLGYNIQLTGRSSTLNQYLNRLTVTIAFPILNRRRLSM